MVKHVSAIFGAIVGVAVLVAATVFFLRPSSDTPPPAVTTAKAPLPQLEKLLLEYPTGEVSADAQLSYRFNQAVVPSNLVGKPAEAMFSSTPANLFTPVWLDQKTLQLTR